MIVSTNLFMDTIIQPVPTSAKRGPYRQHSDEFKRAAVARTQVDRASVSLLARDLKINTNQLFSWRKRFGDETLAASASTAPSQLVAVTVLNTPVAASSAASVSSGMIVVNLGQAQLRLEDQIDAATLTLLLARRLP
ncbi:hypothetical protein CSQ93_04070 [Janthinobacterium sp. BJB426]|nr:hypothetical protein CSQ93_04070 [Janthinobacterium sp. BJB426]